MLNMFYVACPSTVFKPLETLVRTTRPRLTFGYKGIGAPGVHRWSQNTSPLNGPPCSQLERTRLVTNMDTGTL